MFEMLLQGGEIAKQIMEYLVRIGTIVLGGLGSVYIPHKQLKFKMSERQCHTVAVACMLIYSCVITYVYFKDSVSKMIWESFIFWLIANVGYVTVGWHFYSRIDDFLDKHLGKDNPYPDE